MQLCDILRDGHSFGIHPRSLADAVARVYGSRALRRQIGMPGLATGADGTCELLAMTVGASESANVRTLAHPDACDEERHIRLLSVCRNSANQHHARCQRCANSNDRHEIPPGCRRNPSVPAIARRSEEHT